MKRLIVCILLSTLVFAVAEAHLSCNCCVNGNIEPVKGRCEDLGLVRPHHDKCPPGCNNPLVVEGSLTVPFRGGPVIILVEFPYRGVVQYIELTHQVFGSSIKLPPTFADCERCTETNNTLGCSIITTVPLSFPEGATRVTVVTTEDAKSFLTDVIAPQVGGCDCGTACVAQSCPGTCIGARDPFFGSCTGYCKC